MQIDTMVVIPEQKYICINGEGYYGCVYTCVGLHHIYGDVLRGEWFGKYGHIDYMNGPAMMLKDQDWFHQFVTPWVARRAIVLRERAEQLADQLEYVVKQRANHEKVIANLDHDIATLHEDHPVCVRLHNLRAMHHSTLQKLRTIHSEFVTAVQAAKAASDAASVGN